MLRYRKVGGLRFLRCGRVRVSYCVARRGEDQPRLPSRIVEALMLVSIAILAAPFILKGVL